MVSLPPKTHLSDRSCSYYVLVMVYREISFGLKFRARLIQLQATDAMMAECLHCGRQWRIAPHRLHDRFEAESLLEHISGHMRCTRCGSRKFMWWAVRAAPR